MSEAQSLPAPVPHDKRKYDKSVWTGETDLVLKKEALKRMLAYQIDALDAIHELAVMEVSANSAQNQVKLAAAKTLAGIVDAPKAPDDGGITGVLKDLDAAYKKAAPRIASVRERVVTFETEPRVIESLPETPA